jgi:uncharacterized protein (UPF0261 family)
MFVIYHKHSTQIVGKDLKPDHRARYKSMAAAKAAITRAAKKMGVYTGGLMLIDPSHPLYVYGVARAEGFFANIEKKVRKTNLMTGEEYVESVNTPVYMSPSSETYWSM